MMRKKRTRMPLPDDEDIRIARAKKREVVACSAASKGKLLFLKLAFHTGDIATVYVDPIRADYLFRLLKEFLPDDGESDGSPNRFVAEGLTRSHGYLYQ